MLNVPVMATKPVVRGRMRMVEADGNMAGRRRELRDRELPSEPGGSVRQADMTEAQLEAKKFQARWDLFQAMQWRWHDYTEGYLARYAAGTGIDGLEAEVKAVGVEIKRLVEKLRASGPEFLYEEKPRRRHKTT